VIEVPLLITQVYLANKDDDDIETEEKMEQNERYSAWLRRITFIWIIVAHVWYF
jgi:hypothetical protein